MHYVGTTVAVFTKFACIHLQGEKRSTDGFGVVTSKTQQLTGNGVNGYLRVGNKEGGASLRLRMVRQRRRYLSEARS
jgi:hypothetical protein